MIILNLNDLIKHLNKMHEFKSIDSIGVIILDKNGNVQSLCVSANLVQMLGCVDLLHEHVLSLLRSTTTPIPEAAKDVSKDN